MSSHAVGVDKQVYGLSEAIMLIKLSGYFLSYRILGSIDCNRLRGLKISLNELRCTITSRYKIIITGHIGLFFARFILIALRPGALAPKQMPKDCKEKTINRMTSSVHTSNH